MKRSLLLALVFIGLGLAGLHGIHLLAGHPWFATWGALLAALLAVGGARALADRRTASPWRQVGAGAVLLIVFVAPEWLEGELAAGHSLDGAAVGHGWPIALALIAALGLVMALEIRRIAGLFGRR